MSQHPTRFGFHDLRSFTDYVRFVKLSAPDDFPVEGWAGPSERWSLDLAYEGLQKGLEIAASEGVSDTTLAVCRSLFDAAFKHYRARNRVDGFKSMDTAERILRRAPSADAQRTSCWPWLLLVQVPSAIGIIFFATVLSGRVDPGYLALGYLVAWCASVGGTVLTLVATLCFAKSSCGGVGCLLAIGHALYLIILLGLGALFMLAPRESHHGPGPGF